MSKRVLITDDAAFMREMLREILTEGGYEVVAEAAAPRPDAGAAQRPRTRASQWARAAAGDAAAASGRTAPPRRSPHAAAATCSPSCG